MMWGVWLDERIGGEPCYRLCDVADLMRIPDSLLDCVSFLTARWSNAPPAESHGSAFFVGCPLGLSTQIVTGRLVIYAVTAKHCLTSPKLGLASKAWLDLNTTAGDVGRIHTDPSQWILHPTADVAVLPIPLDARVFKYRVYPVGSVATKEFMDQRRVGPGDDVFITGLLVHHPGKTQIMPIARIGNIAALPQDPVELETGGDVVALVEARSIGGLSGSPVFLHLPFWRDPPKGKVLVGGGGEAGSGGEHRLLGVMHGFYPVGQNDPEGVSRGNEDLNTGIAVVVLVDRILDLINDPAQVRIRDAMKTQFETVPRPTSEAGESSEFEKFADLTRKLVQVPKQELDEKRRDKS